MKRPTPLPPIPRPLNALDRTPRFKTHRFTSSAKLFQLVERFDPLMPEEVTQLIKHHNVDEKVLHALYLRSPERIKALKTNTERAGAGKLNQLLYNIQLSQPRPEDIIKHPRVSSNTLCLFIDEFKGAAITFLLYGSDTNPGVGLKTSTEILKYISKNYLDLIQVRALLQHPNFSWTLIPDLYENQGRYQVKTYILSYMTENLSFEEMEKLALIDLYVDQVFNFFPKIDSTTGVITVTEGPFSPTHESMISKPVWTKSLDYFVSKRVPEVTPSEFPIEVLSKFAEDIWAEEKGQPVG